MPRTRFTELMQLPGIDLPLDEASLLISQAIQPGLDADVWFTALDSLAAGCADDSARAVAHHLFTTERFTGNASAYYDWRNSCLDRVIERRAGIPISLSVLMIEVARRAGVELVGIGMPAHFLVRSAADDDLFFDPFDGGRELDRDGARSVFESVTNGQVGWNERFLDPTSHRDIVIRMLNNLKGVFAGGSDAVRLAIVMDMRSAVPELAVQEADEIAATAAVFN